MIPSAVQRILKYYSAETPGIRSQLARLLMHGALKGTGRLLVMAVDQGFEHGPARSFLEHPWGLDPLKHAQLAWEQGLSGLAAPLGFLEDIVDTYPGQIPFILKLNHACSLTSGQDAPHLAHVASVDDAVRLGCVGVGFTLYPGSNMFATQLETLREVTQEARRKSLLVVVWSYPRGAMSKAEERGLDVITYGAHMACLAGAHIIKVKIPDASIMPVHQPYYQAHDTEQSWADCATRIHHVVDACFQGRRLILFSGGEKKSTPELLAEAQAVHASGGSGSILGRNCFQRSYDDARLLLESLTQVYTQTR